MSSLAAEIQSPNELRRVSSAATVRTSVELLNPQRTKDWEEYVATHGEGTFFHQLAWRATIRDAFGHEDLYLVALRSGRLTGALPLFLVSSRLAGRLLISVPYGVGGGMIADDDATAQALADHAVTIATERRCRAIELRSERAALPDWPVNDRYVTFQRQLPTTAADVLDWLPRKARAAARNGRHKFGLEISHGDEHLAQVWHLYSLGMRRLGSLNYPFSFFERIVEQTPGRHLVSLVHWNGRPVGGLLSFLFRDRVLPYFIGTSADARRCSAANFIYLCLMEWAADRGVRIFDFGRSRKDNAGSYDFKRFHGFTPRPLQYQSCVMPGQTPPKLSPSNARYRLARGIWPRLPLWFTQFAGARLAKHIPG